MSDDEKKLLLMKKYVTDKHLKDVTINDKKYLSINCKVLEIRPSSFLGEFIVKLDLKGKMDIGGGDVTSELSTNEKMDIFEFLYVDKLKYFLTRDIAVHFGAPKGASFENSGSYYMLKYLPDQKALRFRYKVNENVLSESERNIQQRLQAVERYMKGRKIHMKGTFEWSHRELDLTLKITKVTLLNDPDLHPADYIGFEFEYVSGGGLTTVDHTTGDYIDKTMFKLSKSELRKELTHYLMNFLQKHFRLKRDVDYELYVFELKDPS